MRAAVAVFLFAAGAAAQPKCADDKAVCNVCDQCCHDYVSAPAACAACAAQQCPASPAPAPPPAPTPPTPPVTPVFPVAGNCNVTALANFDIPGSDLAQLTNVSLEQCGEGCCQNTSCVAFIYVPAGAAFGGCSVGEPCCLFKTSVRGTTAGPTGHVFGVMTRYTPPVPSPPPTAHVCNGTCTPEVCEECCHAYIANGPACDACVNQSCTAVPAPPTPLPTGPGGCVLSGECLPDAGATCCSNIQHISAYCTNSGARCESLAPTPGGCVAADQCIQTGDQKCCSGDGHFSGYCPAAGGFTRC